MQTIIHKTNEYADSDNVVFPVEDVRSLERDLFSEDEIKYIKTNRREHKTDFFAFNRLNNWVFVLLADKERNRTQRLEDYRTRGARLQGVLNEHRVNTVVVVDSEDKPAEVLAFAEGLVLRNYQFIKYKSKPEEKAHSLSSLFLYSRKAGEQDV